MQNYLLNPQDVNGTNTLLNNILSRMGSGIQGTGQVGTMQKDLAPFLAQVIAKKRLGNMPVNILPELNVSQGTIPVSNRINAPNMTTPIAPDNINPRMTIGDLLRIANSFRTR
jgi:hypothetical protein